MAFFIHAKQYAYGLDTTQSIRENENSCVIYSNTQGQGIAIQEQYRAG